MVDLSASSRSARACGRAAARSRARYDESAGGDRWKIQPNPPGEAAEVLEPVLARPHLEPVDDQREAPQHTRSQDGEQREVQGWRLHDVIAPTMA